MIEETAPEGGESDGIPLVPAARHALVGTGRWANWAGVFLGGGVLVTLLSGALSFWQTEQVVKNINSFHVAAGSRAAHMAQRILLDLRFREVFVSGSVIMGAIVGAILAWLALRFGRRLMHIGYSSNSATLTAAAQAQRTFWRTQGMLTLCIMALVFIMTVVMGFYLSSHLHH